MSNASAAPIVPSIYRHLRTMQRSFPTWILLLGGRDCGIVSLWWSEMGNQVADVLQPSTQATTESHS